MDSLERVRNTIQDEEHDSSNSALFQNRQLEPRRREDQDLSHAIQMSLDEFEARRVQEESQRIAQIQSKASETASRQDAHVWRRGRNIEDCVREMLDRPVTEIPLLDYPNGDTWVFIKPPAREPEYSEEAYEAICERYKRPLLASYEILKSLKSPLFEKQLGDATQQFRICRRFKVKQEMEEHGIKYVMDLTPPDEGDEAVQITSDLSCPIPVLNWVHESQLFQVSDTMVAGIDDFSPINAPSPKELAVANATSNNGQADYTPLRHRAAIERVMLCVHGFDIKLDSAPKLWTTVMAATKHLQIPAYSLAVLTDYVTAWLRATPNNSFIELHPDATLKIADALQIEVVCQDAFSLLVGEAAFEASSKHNTSLTSRAGFTTHLRLLDPIDEVWETRLQYSRNAFADRVERIFFQEMAHPDMRWVEQLPEVAAIPVPRDSQAWTIYYEWLSKLKKYAMGAIYHLLCSRYSRLRHLRSRITESGNVFSRPVIQFQNVYNKLSYRERLLTRSFWSSLATCRFPDDHWLRANNTIWPGSGYSIDSSGLTEEYKSLGLAGYIQPVTSRSIEVLSFKLISALNELPTLGTDFTPGTRSSVASEEAGGLIIGQKSSNTKTVSFRVTDSDTKSADSDSDSAQPLYKSALSSCLKAEAYSGSAKNDLPAAGPSNSRNDYTFRSYHFSCQVEDQLHAFGRRFLAHPSAKSTLDFDEVDTLVCLNQDETKYLPLWAGGMDDGSNGVFDADLPTMPEESSFGPARQDLRRSFASSESDFDGASTTLGAPTVATSRMVNDGRSVIMDRRQVYADDEVESVKFDDSVSNAGTESTWEGIDRDDVSVSTSSELVGTIARTRFGFRDDTEAMDEDKDDTAEKGEKSEFFALSDEEDQNNELDELGLADSDQEMMEDSDFEVIDANNIQPKSEQISAKQKQKNSKQIVADWAAANPSEAKNVIRYRERSQSPLVFEKS